MTVTLKCLFTCGEVVGYIFNIPVASSRPNKILLEMQNIFHSSFFFYQLVAKKVLNIGVKIILFPTKHFDSPSIESFKHVFESSKSNWSLEMLVFGRKVGQKSQKKNLSEQERRKLTIKNSTRKWRRFWVINSDHAAGRFNAVKREKNC